eukprot:SRR837773.4590.p1 GENE.SRR837773.4590~~SRR837773.4590.p1  ORF type:complete len:449 (-),score=220.99 SRR837773.4590:25-1344(-)
MGEDKSVQQMQAAGARVLSSSPGLAERLAMTGRSVTDSRASLQKGDDRDLAIQELARQLETEKDRNRSLEDSYRFRVASFIKKETSTRNKIEALERRLNEHPEDEHNVRMDGVRNMHKYVVSSLECIQGNSAKILQDQEKDLMRAFRNRLQEVSREHEALRSRKGEHASDLQAKHRRALGELYEAQELAQSFDRKKRELQAEQQRLQEQLRTREDDRQALLTDLVKTKKEIARLKARAKEEAAEAEAAGSKAQSAPPQTAEQRSFSRKEIDQARLQQTQNKQYQREMSYREAVTKLKRMIEAERRVSRGFKQQHAELLQQRTELEVLLRQCLEDVRLEIERRQLQSPTSAGTSPKAVSSMSARELNDQERERVLDLLMSQQRVVQLLYSKTFAQTMLSPPLPPQEQRSSTAEAAEAAEGRGEDFAWLARVEPPQGGPDG